MDLSYRLAIAPMNLRFPEKIGQNAKTCLARVSLKMPQLGNRFAISIRLGAEKDWLLVSLLFVMDKAVTTPKNAFKAEVMSLYSPKKDS
jgi:hypothetical protein